MTENPKFPVWLFILILASGVGGCKKFVTVPSPETEIVTANVFTNDANATAAQTAIYAEMQSNYDPLNLSLNIGLLADELQNYSSASYQIEFYTNSLLSTDVGNPWVNGYNYIYQANAVLNGLGSYSGVTSPAKLQLAGEAKFIRAFWTFYLTNCYGEVPLITTTNYASNATASRTPTEQVYAQIIADLTDAESQLNQNYVDATDSVVTTERVRPTKTAAAAMLARAYLYIGKYDSAEEQSTLVIDNPNIQLCYSLDSVFLKNNSEAIWQIPPTQPNSNLAVPEGMFFILNTAPGGGNSYNNATISSQLMNSFEPNDLRQVHWINVYNDGSTNFYYPFKYKQYQSATLSEYTVVLRLAEQYLIRAEARAQLGNTSGSISDLNTIRERAGLAPYGGATDKNDLVTAILHERQVELFTEWGHRWFDLARTNTINSVMSTVTPQKGGVWNVNSELFPIPFVDLSYDPKLVQNPGYTK